MDSQLVQNGRIVFLVDRSWREDASNLPNEDLYVPTNHLPDPEPDNGNPTETLKEMDLKWTDLALSSILSDSTNY
ncbi:Anaphase-promoting complex subunit 13 [Blomia tropicalis]|nr:Anaphase-promoting complex subunit 13 [Blomia tropicalis]